MEASGSRARAAKHIWTDEEDRILVECLVQCVQSGHWQADNGTFRPGFLSNILRMMQHRIPGCSIQVSPHLESRVRTLKRQYSAIVEMLGPGCNGFGWNVERKCIDCEAEIFDAWVKVIS